MGKMRLMTALVMMLATTVQVEAAQDIKTKAGKPWPHKDSGFAFPAVSGAFVRRDMSDISDGKRIDISATYDDPTTGSVATLYLYRPAMPDASLWFDIANWFLQRNDRFGATKPAGGPTAFQIAPTGGSAALRQSYAISAAGRSTGVAIVPVGPWLIKLRMTSAAADPPLLDRMMRDFLNALPWPKRMPAAADGLPIAPCSTKLGTARADQIKQDPGMIIVGTMLASMAKEDEEKPRDPAEPPARLCRDDAQTGFVYPLYQIDEGRTGYVMAIGDSGTLLSVRNDPDSAVVSAELAGGTSEEAPAFFRVTVMTPQQWEQFPAFAQLPPPVQAMEVVRQSRPLSVTKILGKGTQVILDEKSFE